MSSTTSRGDRPAQGKLRSLVLLALGQLLAMSLWFSASAVVPQLEREWSLGPGSQAWLTMSVQVGFVAGALLSASLGLADRVSTTRLIAASTLLAAAANAAIPLLDLALGATLFCRFVTGAMLAAVYPPGMRLVASWTVRDRGLGIGLLVGAITVGSALPHLLNAVPLFGPAGMPPWRPVVVGASLAAVAGGLIVAVGVRQGPHLPRPGRFEWSMAGRSLSERASRLANFGYLGHMWELYAAWTWVPIFLLESFSAAGWSQRAARLAGFGMVAVGGVGCVVAGYLADRFGRTTLTVWSLAVSGSCCLLAGFSAGRPGVLTFLSLVWGFAVVADSAQFSAALSELADRRWVGTALTVQTCLGFLLTLGTIRLVPWLRDLGGWKVAFSLLAIGPALGIVSMLRLRRLPEAARMASGRR